MRIIQGEKPKPQEMDEWAEQIQALIYVRVSTDEQARHGYSLESQVERCADLAYGRLGLRKDQLLVLVEAGERGDNPDRPMINYVLELLEKGVGNKVILLHPDRLSRYLFLQMELSAKIWDRGGDIEFVEFDLDRENPESMLMFNIQGSIAQYNKAKILANTKRGRRTKARQGQLPGMRRLFGYRFDKATDQLLVHSGEKEIYLRMVELLLSENLSCSAIARELAVEKLPGPDGDIWYQATVSRILKNEAYTGNYYYGKTETVQLNGKSHVKPRPREDWIAISIPAFIDEETYLRIQEKLKQVKKVSSGRPSERYLLKGMARCGRCSSAVSTGVSSNGKNRTLTYYTCTNKSGKAYAAGGVPAKQSCRGRNWRTDQVDQLVWEELLKLIDTELLIGEYLQYAADDKSLQVNGLHLKLEGVVRSLQSCEKKRKQLLDLYLEGIVKSKEDLRLKLREIEQQTIQLAKKEKQTRQELQQAFSSDAILEEHMVNCTSELHKRIQSGQLPLSERRALLAFVVETVVLHENGDIAMNLRISKSTHQKLIHGEGDGGLQKSICTDFSRISRRDG